MMKTPGAEISEAVAEDVVGIVFVQATNWISHYPTRVFDITEDDIRSVDFNSKIAAWQHILRSPQYRIWVAKEEQSVVGFIAARKDSEGGEIYEQHTLPDHQKQGVGRRLLEQALVWIGANLSVSLRTPSYAPGISFYERQGFAIDNEGMVDFIHLPSGKQIPTILMSRPAGSEPLAKARPLLESADKASIPPVTTSPNLVSRAQLAKLSGTRPSTIKFYTETGLLEYRQAAARLARRYDRSEALQRLDLVKQLRQQGLSIAQIKQQLAD
ncbi:GNAT family N-acetyltransferase [Candidatus Microgenomates bacterium]|nr:GNAT family N-acetyltransferase [Candidatus Microgenomates bacterium]